MDLVTAVASASAEFDTKRRASSCWVTVLSVLVVPCHCQRAHGLGCPLNVLTADALPRHWHGRSESVDPGGSMPVLPRRALTGTEPPGPFKLAPLARLPVALAFKFKRPQAAARGRSLAQGALRHSRGCSSRPGPRRSRSRWSGQVRFITRPKSTRDHESHKAAYATSEHRLLKSSYARIVT